MEGLVEEKESLSSQLAELRRAREELTADNRRLAEILVTTEAESGEAAAMLETLTRERKELRKQSLQLRESGEGERGGLSASVLFSLNVSLSVSLSRVSPTEEGRGAGEGDGGSRAHGAG